MGPDMTAQGLPPLKAILLHVKVKVPDVSSSALSNRRYYWCLNKITRDPCSWHYLPANKNVKMVQPLRLLLFCYLRALMWQPELSFNSFLHPLSFCRTSRWFGSISCGDAAEIRAVIVRKQRILLSKSFSKFLLLCYSLMFIPFVFLYKKNNVQAQPISVDLKVSSARAQLKLISVYPKSKQQFAFSLQLYTSRQAN